MTKRLFTLLLAVAASVGTMFAQKVKIGDLYYNLDATNKTAEVTYELYLNSTNYKGLTTANIPVSVTYSGTTYTVTSIGESAFSHCTGLTSVTIPNSVTRIGGSAFFYCTGLTGELVIPNSVTSIGESAFQDCYRLTSVTIPNSVTSIGKGAFYGCSGLTSINVASDNSNYCSVDGVLFNKGKTTLIQYPGGKQGAYTIPNSVTSIGNYAFRYCTGLTSVTIGNSVTSIGYQTFYGCASLTSVTIPNSVTSIGDETFYGCTGLTSVTIPNSVTSIGGSTFRACTGLTSVTIPNSVTRIGGSAFQNCYRLTSVTIPNSVTYIGESAFYGCSGLTSVTNFANTPQEITSSVFDKVDKSTCVLYVPAGSISVYQSADVWKDFTNILPISQQGIDNTPFPSGNAWGETRKVLHNGQIYLLRGDKTYTLTGQETIMP